MSTSTIKKQLGRVVDLGSPMKGVGPFIFASHLVDKYPEANGKLGPKSTKGHSIGSDFRNPAGWSMYHGNTVPGFPAHPHTGFETVSIVRSGFIDHGDSTGAGARYGPGDVQWVTAGSGVSHSEMFPMVHDDKPNPFEMYQMWLNLPAKNKNVPPEFVMLWREKIPVVQRESTHGVASVNVIAGAFDGVEPLAPPSGSYGADPNSDLAIWLVDLDPKAVLKLPTTNNPDTKRLLYVIGKSARYDINGPVRVNIGGSWVDAGQGFEQEPGSAERNERLTLTNGDEKATVLVLQGVDLNEPIVQRGPFVANTTKELNAKFAEYSRTEFGGWPWPNHQPTYPATEPRFAKFPDGRTEYPDKDFAKH